MASQIRKWINDRIPVDKIIRSAIDESIPGGSSFFFTLGSATLFIFVLQIVTGIWQLFYYVPTVDHAYDSVTFLELSVPFGWLIHGLHYWGASAMAVLVGLHVLRVFIWGAYKKPRELTWLLGVILILLTVVMIFTGAVLPWDERGYWAAEVGTSIAGSVPLIGNGLKFLLLGGQKMGQVALSRFFILHAAIVPVLAIIIIMFHLIAFRKFGSVGPWAKEKRTQKGNFWPDQISKDIIVAVFLFLLIVTLAVFKPPPFTGPADPLDTTFVPKPEWNFLFLYEALKFFPGYLEVLGTVGIPALIIFIFVSLPFLDKKRERNPFKRPIIILSGFVFVGLLLTLTVIGYNSGAKQEETKSTHVATKQTVLTTAALNGKKIFDMRGCIACHIMNNTGGKIGPDLTEESQKGRTRVWIVEQIKDPHQHYSSSIMPAYAMLSDSELNDLTDYLLSSHAVSNSANTTKSGSTLAIRQDSSTNSGGPSQHGSSSLSRVNNKGDNSIANNSSKEPGFAAGMIGNVAHGSVLYQLDCESCHGVNGKGGIPNPGSLTGTVPSLNPVSKILFDKNPQIFAEKIDRYIQHGSIPKGPDPALLMINYGDSYTLTQQQIANIEAYILNLNGVNRAELQVTSFSPEQYYAVVLGVFIVICIFLGFIRYSQKRVSEH